MLDGRKLWSVDSKNPEGFNVQCSKSISPSPHVLREGDIQSCRPGNNPLGYYCTTQYNYENTGNTPTSYFFNNVDGRKMEILVSV